MEAIKHGKQVVSMDAELMAIIANATEFGEDVRGLHRPTCDHVTEGAEQDQLILDGLL